MRKLRKKLRKKKETMNGDEEIEFNFLVLERIKNPTSKFFRTVRGLKKRIQNF